MHMVWRGVWGPPSNSGLQGLPFQAFNITHDPLRGTFEFDQPYTQTERKMQVTGKILSIM